MSEHAVVEHAVGRRSMVPDEVSEISVRSCARCGGQATCLVVETRGRAATTRTVRFYCRRCADEVSRLTSPEAMASRRLRQRRHELTLV